MVCDAGLLRIEIVSMKVSDLVGSRPGHRLFLDTEAQAGLQAPWPKQIEALREARAANIIIFVR